MTEIREQLLEMTSEPISSSWEDAQLRCSSQTR
jgi:hypothetical protein